MWKQAAFQNFWTVIICLLSSKNEIHELGKNAQVSVIDFDDQSQTGCNPLIDNI